MSLTPAASRQWRLMLWLLVLCGVTSIGLVALLDGTGWFGTLSLVFATLHAAPFIGAFILFGRYLRDLDDEYLRTVQARHAILATGLSMTFAVVWGVMEGFGRLPHLNPCWIAAAWFVGLIAARHLDTLLHGGRAADA